MFYSPTALELLAMRHKLQLLGLEENDVVSDEEYASSEDDLADWDGPLEGVKSKNAIINHGRHLNQQGASEKITKYQTADKLFSKVSGRINIDAYEVPGGDVLKSVSGGRFVFLLYLVLLA